MVYKKNSLLRILFLLAVFFIHSKVYAVNPSGHKNMDVQLLAKHALKSSRTFEIIQAREVLKQARQQYFKANSRCVQKKQCENVIIFRQKMEKAYNDLNHLLANIYYGEREGRQITKEEYASQPPARYPSSIGAPWRSGKLAQKQKRTTPLTVKEHDVCDAISFF